MPVSNRTKNEVKRCGRCKEFKPISEFGKVKGKSRSYCRPCHSSQMWTPDLRTNKRCPSCKETKPVNEFNRLGARYQPTCRECQNLRSGIKNAELKDSGMNVEVNRRGYRRRRKWIKLKSKYGITKETFLQMVEEQGNLCAICKQPETETSSPHIDEMELSVDHCHKTGQVRGLLCRQCNIALGKFKEDIEVLKSAIAYLQRGAQRREEPLWPQHS